MTDWIIDSHDALTASDGVAALAKTVLIVTDDLDGVGDLGQTLIGLGYRVQVALIVGDLIRGMPSLTPDVILLSLNARADDCTSLARAVRAHVKAPLVPLIGYLAAHTERPEGLDSVLFHPCHRKQIAHRVDAMVRLQAMQHEILRRSQVLRLAYQQHHEIKTDSLIRKLRVLFIGKAKPEFMIILNALRARNVEVTAAFTSFTAFDYLHGREFDAVIIDATNGHEPATSILSSMSRNVRLYHMPKILLGQKENGLAIDPDLLRDATDIIAGDDVVTELTNRILEPANYHRLHSQLRAEFDSMGDERTRDADTGLFNADFLNAYLDFLESEGEARTVVHIRMVPDADFAIDAPFIRVAMAQAGGLLAGLVRVNDLVARLGEDTFAIAIPPTTEANLDGIMNRIAGVLECAAFESGKKRVGPFSMQADIKIAGDPGYILAA